MVSLYSAMKMMHGPINMSMNLIHSDRSSVGVSVVVKINGNNPRKWFVKVIYKH